MKIRRERKKKVINISKYQKKRYWPVLLAVILVLLAAGGIVGYHFYDEYHTYGSSNVREFDTITEDQNDLRLVTEKKELLGRMYVGFTIKSPEDDSVIYQCPDLYPVSQLSDIGWEADTDSVAVEKKDGSKIVYTRSGTKWEK